MRQIKASAGSGKTFQLTQKFVAKLAELAQTDNPELMALWAMRIMAVTFTNAAASEMRERVIKTIKEAALAKDNNLLAPEAAQKWLDIVLRNLDILNIRTIDSLLHQITRASALKLGLHPDYETEFDTKEALNPYLELALEKALLDDAQENKDRRAILLTACRAFMENSKGFYSRGNIARALSDTLESALLGKYDQLSPGESYFEFEDKLPEKARAAAENLLHLAEKHKLKWGSRKKSQVEKYAAASAENKAEPQIVKDRDIGKVFPDENIPDAVRAAYAEFCQAVSALYKWPRLIEQSRRFGPLTEFAREIIKDFNASQMEEGKLLQALVSRYAGAALADEGGVTDALIRMSLRLRDFLVDEFQDTSREQWGALKPLVLEGLSTNGEFTWVGDVKQSIYGWRGGDSRLFNDIFNDAELGAVAQGRKTDSLATNWRSRPEIIRHTNKFFASMLDAKNAAELIKAILPDKSPEELIENAAKDIARAYADVAQTAKPGAEAGGYVSFSSVEAGKTEELQEASANYCLDILQNNIAARRPWSDVLILVRDGKHASRIAEKLASEDIPAITENGLLLKENALVIEIIAFLRFLKNSEDELAFWTIIKGEIFGDHPAATELAGVDLAAWRAKAKNVNLVIAFKTDFPDLWQKIFQPFFDTPDYQAPYDLVSEWYNRLNILSRFQQDSAMLERFLETVHMAGVNGINSLQDFLEFWESKGHKEKAPMPENMNAVRVMTIHKAKGLEAPVVIIPSTNFELKMPTEPVAVKLGDKIFAVKLSIACGDAYYENLLKQTQEALNLLYVAMTRAEEELYIQHTPAKKNTQIRYFSLAVNKMLAMAGLGEAYEMGELPEKALEKVGNAQENVENLAAMEARSELPEWRPLDWMPRLKIFRSHLDSARLTQKERGILLHTCLERMTITGNPEKDAEAACLSALRQSGVVVSVRARNFLLKGLTWFAALPQAKEWLSQGWPEQSLMDSEGRIKRPDLIVQKKAGPLVIDYKSGQPNREHVAQVQAYLDCLAETEEFAGEPVGLLIYIDRQEFQKITRQGASKLEKRCPV